jgi:hypothetical protein
MKKKAASQSPRKKVLLKSQEKNIYHIVRKKIKKKSLEALRTMEIYSKSPYMI